MSASGRAPAQVARWARRVAEIAESRVPPPPAPPPEPPPPPAPGSFVLDSPTGRLPVGDAIEIRGWASVPGEAADALPEVRYDGAAVPVVLWREERGDVALQLEEPADVRHGFGGWADVSDEKYGDGELVVSLGGHRCEVAVTRRRPDVRLELERPVDGVAYGRVRLAGWAATGDGTRAETLLAGPDVRVPGRHWVLRSDLAAAHPELALDAGFVVDTPLPRHPGDEVPLALVATDDEGLSVMRPLLGLAASDEPIVVVERVLPDGDEVRVEGLVRGAPRGATLELRDAAGAVVAVAETGLSRPMADDGAPARDGFSVSSALAGEGAVIVLADGGQTLAEQPVALHGADASRAGLATAVAELAPPGATLLALGTTVARGELQRRYELASMSRVEDAAGLLEGEFDVVVHAPADAAAAERVAALGRVELGADAPRAHPARRVTHATTRVSVLMPSYGDPQLAETCVRAMLASRLDPGVELELIAVDDCCPADSYGTLSRVAEQDSRLTVVRNEVNLGAPASVNHAATFATGDMLLLLNDDAIADRDAVRALLAGFAVAPRAGYVGAAFVWPDGRLQESGAHVFADGSAHQLGSTTTRPHDPLFACTRPADYVSSALVVTPRALWDELGGLDTQFNPGGYDDTDYCFRCLEHDRPVIVAPAAFAVHQMQSRWARPTTHQENFARRWPQRLAELHQPRPDVVDRRVERRLMDDAAERQPRWRSR